MLCTGVEDNVGLQSEDCLAVDKELPAFHANCRGKSECKTYFSGLVGAPWTGECQETELTRTNEMRVLYRCGEIIFEQFPVKTALTTPHSCSGVLLLAGLRPV